METIIGKYILIDEYNIYFKPITEFLLQYHDTEENKDSVIIIGTYNFHNVEFFRNKYPNKKIIIYQLEHMVGGGYWRGTDSLIDNIIGADEIWDFDLLNIAYLSTYRNVKVDKHVPLLYTYSLDRLFVYDDDMDIDLLFFGYMSPRRYEYLQILQKHFYNKLKFMFVYGIQGGELDYYIERSKIILNVHAFGPYSRQEQPRIFYLLINGKCVLSEETQLNYYGDMIVEFNKDNFVDKINYLLNDYNYMSIGLDAKEKFRKCDFKDVKI